MPTRTISITDEAYQRLKMNKKENDSFTDVINRMTGKRDIMQFAGILSDNEADQIKEHIKSSRARSKVRNDKIREMMR